MGTMTSLSEQLPHVTAFPHALGTGILLHTGTTLSSDVYARIDSFIADYEAVLSRFRDDSIVGRMRTASHGGTFDFPDWASELFELYDRLFAATNGAIDPCVGEDLIRLGYDESYSFASAPDAAEHAGAIHGRATWAADVERHGSTLVTHGPVSLDFGACGKGYLVDLIAGILNMGHPQPATPPAPASGGKTVLAPDDGYEAAPAITDRSDTALAPAGGGCLRSGLGVDQGTTQYVIDAGGDLLIRANSPIVIVFEDPTDPANAVGTAELSNGSFCASAPSRRHWTDAAGHQLHHLLNAIDGLPVTDVAATWVAVIPEPKSVATPSPQYPTATADGLATALFTTSASQLRVHFPFECAILTADRTAAQSTDFPGAFFTE